METDFDRRLIDLSLLHPAIRTGAAYHAVGLTCAFLVKQPPQLGERRIDLTMLAQLLVRDGRLKEALPNALAGRSAG